MSMDLARKDFSTAPEYFIAGTDIGIAKATKTAKNKKKNVEKVARQRSNDNDGQAARRVANNAS